MVLLGATAVSAALVQDGLMYKYPCKASTWEAACALRGHQALWFLA